MNAVQSRRIFDLVDRVKSRRSPTAFQIGQLAIAEKGEEFGRFVGLFFANGPALGAQESAHIDGVDGRTRPLVQLQPKKEKIANEKRKTAELAFPAT